MRRLPRRLAMLTIAALALAALPTTVSAAGGTVVTVNQTDLGITWVQATLLTGEGAFEAGPGTPPLGDGSYAMRTQTANDKVTLVTGAWFEQPLADLTGLDYWTYRDGTSTSPSYVAPSINVAIFTNASGPGTGFATLVYEPLYAFGNDAILDDTWQHWDTFVPGEAGFAGGWWVTRQVGAICAIACYTTFEDIVANAPDATIISVGVNVGRGPATFLGATDALSVTYGGATTTFDFEPLVEDKDGCKDGGWADFHDQTFTNQGRCVSWFASENGRAHRADAANEAAERRAEREAERAAQRAERAADRAAEKAAKTDKAAKPDQTPKPKGGDAKPKGD